MPLEGFKACLDIEQVLNPLGVGRNVALGNLSNPKIRRWGLDSVNDVKQAVYVQAGTATRCAKVDEAGRVRCASRWVVLTFEKE
jgi:hypothetical protein